MYFGFFHHKINVIKVSFFYVPTYLAKIINILNVSSYVLLCLSKVIAESTRFKGFTSNLSYGIVLQRHHMVFSQFG